MSDLKPKRIMVMGLGSVRSAFHNRIIGILVRQCNAEFVVVGHPDQINPSTKTKDVMFVDEVRDIVRPAMYDLPHPPMAYDGEKKSKGDKKRARAALNRKGWR